MVVGGACGFLIGIATILQIKFTSPLTHNISGTAKSCVQTVLALIIWRNATNAANMLGVLMVLLGSSAYSVVRGKEMEAASKEKAAAAAAAGAAGSGGSGTGAAPSSSSGDGGGSNSSSARAFDDDLGNGGGAAKGGRAASAGPSQQVDLSAYRPASAYDALASDTRARKGVFNPRHAATAAEPVRSSAGGSLPTLIALGLSETGEARDAAADLLATLRADAFEVAAPNTAVGATSSATMAMATSVMGLTDLPAVEAVDLGTGIDTRADAAQRLRAGGARLLATHVMPPASGIAIQAPWGPPPQQMPAVAAALDDRLLCDYLTARMFQDSAAAADIGIPLSLSHQADADTPGELVEDGSAESAPVVKKKRGRNRHLVEIASPQTAQTPQAT